jgi:hypothetical protein
MELESSIGRLLPRMIPLGVLTLAVVLAWSRFYTVIAEVACSVSAAIGAGQCSAGTVPDPQGLLNAVTQADARGEGRKQLCSALASLPFPVEGCDGASSDPPCREQARLGASTCDPTKWLRLGTSPGLSDCDVVAKNQTLPYEFEVKPRAVSRGPGCNVTRIRVDGSARVTFCFQSLRLKVDRGFPDKLRLGQEYVDANPSNYCGAGELEGSYDALSGGEPTSRLDIGRYALKSRAGVAEVVVIPATVTGPRRTDSDDRNDFSYSRRALAVERLKREGNASPSTAEIAAAARQILNDYEQKGFTWHHADLLRGADGRYYYRMILVPSAIHDTTPHDGGSAWARGRGVTQDPKSFDPPWDPLDAPPALSTVLRTGWPDSVSRELPEECRPCSNE